MLSSNTSAVSGDTTYIEDVFSTYLYTGNSSTQNIVNGIDLSTKGGMVWTKSRNAAYDNTVYDTARGTGSTKALYTDTTDAQGAYSSFQDLTSYNTNGYSIGSPILLNETGKNYVSWTFRKQPKFFDVVTFTAGTSTNQRISHSLGSTPGCIIVKRTDSISNWITYHRSLTNPITNNVWLDTTDAQYSGLTNQWGTSLPTSTDFGMNATYLANGGSYVAYLFAHDAGGFGLTGTDNVISCGSYTGTGAAGNNVTLGYEPQWLMIKESSASNDWVIFDNMRGMTVAGVADASLYPNLSDAEVNVLDAVGPTATGFTLGNTPYSLVNASGQTYIYIAIRRGPMKVPTDGTKVFAPVLHNNTGATELNAGFPPDLAVIGNRDGAAYQNYWLTKLCGGGSNITAPTGAKILVSTSTSGEGNNNYFYLGQNGFGVNTSFTTSNVMWHFRRAPSFFDEVCYTGTGPGTPQTQKHNLGVAPELMILKKRSDTAAWPVYHKDLGNSSLVYLNLADAKYGPGYDHFGQTTPTATQFYLNGSNEANGLGATYVAYLFATCPGVSKVGSYTGTGTTKQVDCGFAAGTRFVLIKRTDSTGDWYVWDTARGIVSGNDPYLLLNSTAAETTTTDYIDTYSAGFELSSTAPAALNASGGTYIFLAIA